MTTIKKIKSPQDSLISMREMVMPNQTNPQNTIFGGVVMSWIDIAAAMSATKHSQRNVVTVHVADISFLSPIKIGHHVSITASVSYVGSTSMLVGVKVESENPYTNEKMVTTRAYLTFVALDEDGKPTAVPRLKIVTKDEKRRFENAKIRMANQKKLRSSLK